MKSVSFLRNTWRKKDRSSPASSGETSPLKDGFWDEMDRKGATYPMKKSRQVSYTLPSRRVSPAQPVRPSLPHEVMASVTGGLVFPTRESTKDHVVKEPNLAQEQQKPSAGLQGQVPSVRQRVRSLGAQQPPPNLGQRPEVTPDAPSLPPSPPPKPVPLSPTSPRHSPTLPLPKPTPPPSPTTPHRVSTSTTRSPSRRSVEHARVPESPRKLESRALLPKRSMPELDGVWKGFLEDVEEDIDSLQIMMPTEKSPLKRKSSASISRSHGRTISRQYLATLPPSPAPSPISERTSPLPSVAQSKGFSPVKEAPSRSAHTRPRLTTASTSDILSLTKSSASPAPSPMSERAPSLPLNARVKIPSPTMETPVSRPSRVRPRLSTASSSESSSSLPYLKSYSPIPSPLGTDESPSTSHDSLSFEEALLHSPSDFRLSMFPAPPPLSAPHTPPRTSSRTYTLSPVLLTPEHTPTTTPTTARFPPAPSPIIRKTSSPTSILKKASISCLSSSPLPTPPITPDALGFPTTHVHPQSRAGTRSNSSYHVQTVRSPGLHRPSSSDSTSDKSSPSNSLGHGSVRKRALSRPEVPVYLSPVPNAVHIPQAAGLPRSLSPTEIQWGYAV